MEEALGSTYDLNQTVSEAEFAKMIGVSVHSLRRYRRAGRPLAPYLQPTPRRVSYLISDVRKAIARMRQPDVAEAAVASARAAMEDLEAIEPPKV